MSQVVTGPARADAPAHPLPRRHGLLGDLDRPGDVFARLGPNWFASVMGTGIVATAAATLPVQWPGVRGFATAVWVLSAVWLITLTGAEVVLWTRHRDAARAHACDPVMVQFYGAPPMTLLTVGAGTLLLGPPLIGAPAAIAIDAVLWSLGTITGLAASVAVPYLMFTRLRAAPDAAFGGWLMPVVPPMVSASTGALLLPHLPAGQPRLPRRNGWTIAEQAGDRTPDRTQRLLNRAAWDAFAAMGVIRRFAVAGLDEAAPLWPAGGLADRGAG